MKGPQKLEAWKRVVKALTELNNSLDAVPDEEFELSYFVDSDTYAGEIFHGLPHVIEYVDDLISQAELTKEKNNGQK